jgi:hypothetical protein
MPVTKALPRTRNATYRIITQIPLFGPPRDTVSDRTNLGVRDRYHGIGLLEATLLFSAAPILLGLSFDGCHAHIAARRIYRAKAAQCGEATEIL